MEFWLHVDIQVPVQVHQIPGGMFVVTFPALPGVSVENAKLCGALDAAKTAIVANVVNTGGPDCGRCEFPGAATEPSDGGSMRASPNTTNLN